MRLAFYRLVLGFVLAITIAAPIGCSKKDPQLKLAGNGRVSFHEKQAATAPSEENQLASRD